MGTIVSRQWINLTYKPPTNRFCMPEPCPPAAKPAIAPTTATRYRYYRFPKPKRYWYDPIFAGVPRQNHFPLLMDLEFDLLHQNGKDIHVSYQWNSTERGQPKTFFCKHVTLHGLPTARIPVFAPVFKYAKISITRKMSDILRVLVAVVVVVVVGQHSNLLQHFWCRMGLGIHTDPLFVCYNKVLQFPVKKRHVWSCLHHQPLQKPAYQLGSPGWYGDKALGQPGWLDSNFMSDLSFFVFPLQRP